MPDRSSCRIGPIMTTRPSPMSSTSSRSWAVPRGAPRRIASDQTEESTSTFTSRAVASCSRSPGRSRSFRTGPRSCPASVAGRTRRVPRSPSPSWSHGRRRAGPPPEGHRRWPGSSPCVGVYTRERVEQDGERRRRATGPMLRRLGRLFRLDLAEALRGGRARVEDEPGVGDLLVRVGLEELELVDVAAGVDDDRLLHSVVLRVDDEIEVLELRRRLLRREVDDAVGLLAELAGRVERGVELLLEVSLAGQEADRDRQGAVLEALLEVLLALHEDDPDGVAVRHLAPRDVPLVALVDVVPAHPARLLEVDLSVADGGPSEGAAHDGLAELRAELGRVLIELLDRVDDLAGVRRARGRRGCACGCAACTAAEERQDEGEEVGFHHGAPCGRTRRPFSTDAPEGRSIHARCSRDPLPIPRVWPRVRPGLLTVRTTGAGRADPCPSERPGGPTARRRASPPRPPVIPEATNESPRGRRRSGRARRRRPARPPAPRS